MDSFQYEVSVTIPINRGKTLSARPTYQSDSALEMVRFLKEALPDTCKVLCYRRSLRNTTDLVDVSESYLEQAS